MACRVAVAQESGLERPANAPKASNGQSRMTTTVFIYCPSEERVLRKKFELWFGTAQDSQARFKGPEMVSEASRLQIPEAWPEKLGRSWASTWLEMVWEIFRLARQSFQTAKRPELSGKLPHCQKWSGRLPSGQMMPESLASC